MGRLAARRDPRRLAADRAGQPGPLDAHGGRRRAPPAAHPGGAGAHGAPGGAHAGADHRADRPPARRTARGRRRRGSQGGLRLSAADVRRRRPDGHRGGAAAAAEGAVREVLLDADPAGGGRGDPHRAGLDHDRHGRRETRRTGRRPDERADPGVRERRSPHRRGDRLDPPADGGRRSRDDDLAHRERRGQPVHPSRAAGAGALRRGGVVRGGRGDAALLDAHLARPDPVRGRGRPGRRPGDTRRGRAHRLVRRAGPRRARPRSDGGPVRPHPHVREPAHLLRPRPARVPRCGPVPDGGGRGAPGPVRPLPAPGPGGAGRGAAQQAGGHAERPVRTAGQAG